jgi:hypothetical protein
MKVDGKEVDGKVPMKVDGKEVDGKEVDVQVPMKVEGKVPPLWGGSLRWASLSNTMTSPEVANSSASWMFDYYYDATQGATAWHHHAGQHDWVCSV